MLDAQMLDCLPLEPLLQYRYLLYDVMFCLCFVFLSPKYSNSSLPVDLGGGGRSGSRSEAQDWELWIEATLTLFFSKREIFRMFLVHFSTLLYLKSLRIFLCRRMLGLNTELLQRLDSQSEALTTRLDIILMPLVDIIHDSARSHLFVRTLFYLVE